MPSLKTSARGKAILKQAREAKGWKVDDVEFFRAASQILKPEQDWENIADPDYFAFSRETLKRFLYGTASINAKVYKACCLALAVNWEAAIEHHRYTSQQPNLNLPHDFFAYDEAWVGRSQLIGELSAKIRANCRLLLLLGLTGIGKTALAERLVLELEDGNWEKLLRANFDYQEKSTDFATIAAKWLEELGENLRVDEKKPDILLQRLVGYLQHHRVLLLIDSLETLLTTNEEDEWGNFADRYWEQFFVELLSAPLCQCRIIITSQDLPVSLVNDRYKNFWYRQILYGLEEAEQIALFEKTGLDTAQDRTLLMRIGKAYQGHPLVLRVIIGEIQESFYGDIQVYWNYVGSKIAEVETAIAVAEADASQIMGADDEWKLHKLTQRVRLQVNKKRLQTVFERLGSEVKDAYLLICAASVYRLPVQEEGWLMQLGNLVRRLEGQPCNAERQYRALDALGDRFLFETSFNHNKKRLLGQHNLIRSVALEQYQNLINNFHKLII